MFRLHTVPSPIVVDYDIACEHPDTVLQDSLQMADRRWDKALILAIAFATGAGKTIPMTPSKSLYYFQQAKLLTYQLDLNTGNIARRAILTVFEQVMDDMPLRGDFARAILEDMQLNPRAAERLKVHVGVATPVLAAAG